MLFHRYGTFTGGIDLPDEKQGTINRRIEPVSSCPRLIVSLAPCGGGSGRPLVRTGERVTAGQRIAEAVDRFGVDIFAPLSGRVEAIDAIAAVATINGFAITQAIALTDLEPSGCIVSPPPNLDWREKDRQELHDRLEDGAITTFCLPVVPMARWVELATAKKCDLLIANVMEGQPYVTANHRLLAEYGEDVVGGLAILGKLIGARRMMLAVDGRRTEDYPGLIAPAGSYGVNRIALSNKYPTSNDTMLVKALTRRERPPGGELMDVGAAVVDAATCFAVFRWIACRQRATHRVVTVAGERIEEGGNYWAPMGLGCAELADMNEAPIHGGPMSGLRCPPDAVVSPSTNAILAIVEPSLEPPSPCIRCDWCTDLCPARLNVAILNDDFELSLVDHARSIGTMACVECGVCSYVCPARLPLAQRVRQLKEAILRGNRSQLDGGGEVQL